MGPQTGKSPEMTKREAGEPSDGNAVEGFDALVKPVWVWGLPLAPWTRSEVIEVAGRLIERGRPSYFVTANLHYAMLSHQMPELREVNDRASFILADGAPLVWASRWQGHPLPERVAGSDLIYDLAELCARRGFRLFLLGGAAGVADRAAANLVARYPGLEIAGTYSPPFRELTEEEQAALIDRVRTSRADLLLTAFTMPRGERWIARHLEELGVPLCASIGAGIDFAAGRVKRAPQWMQKVGLEWFYRMALEPGRLGPRYARNMQFLARMVVGDWVGSWSGKKASLARPSVSPAGPAPTVGEDGTIVRSYEIDPEQIHTLVPQPLNVLIVIVCYKVPDLTIDCLRSLAPQIGDVAGTKVAVCENGTGPQSVEEIRRAIETEGWSDWVMLKAIYPNRGFTGGNNAILGEVMAWPEPPKYLILLNADTIVRPGAIRELVRAAELRPEAGLIGPRLEWPDGEPQISAFRYFSPVSEFLAAARTGPLTRLFKGFEVPIPVSDEPMTAQWVTLACALVRKEVFERVGLLDEGYYLYFDDVDLCHRARRVGWEVVYWPAARVVHLRGRSNPVKETTLKRERRPRYWYESRARYFAKCHSRPTLWAANLAWWLGRGVSLAREMVGNKARHTCQHEHFDVWTNIFHPMKTNPPGQGASRS